MSGWVLHVASQVGGSEEGFMALIGERGTAIWLTEVIQPSGSSIPGGGNSQRAHVSPALAQATTRASPRVLPPLSTGAG